ncbi:MAG TPA: DUF3857 domain-containing protein [Candidatus Koribacter sp.]|jgi:hypothetical protein
MRTITPLLLGSILAISPALLTQKAHAQWQPIPPEDLALKDNPAQPGAKAMILYRSVERDDDMGKETQYVRIKVFTEEGKEYGDVSLPLYNRGEVNIESIAARTIHPDGSIVPFNGKVFEKLVVQSRDFKYYTKAFTLADVTPGSILEYKYTVRWDNNLYFSHSEWDVSADLYERVAHFLFKPLQRGGEMYWALRTQNLPEEAKTNYDKNRQIVTLDVNNLPAVQKETYMPPKDEIAARVVFFYQQQRIPAADEFWKNYGKDWHNTAESFMNKKGAVSRDLEQVVSASDSPDVKLHKIYDHVQSFKNMTFEESKSEKEIKALKIREIKNVESVIESKSGYRNELNRTFVALARAAGLDATLVSVAERNNSLLHKDWPSGSQLEWEIALAKLDGKTIFLDPGTPFCPFGILPWEDTMITGLQLDKNAPVWTEIPASDPATAGIHRVAHMALSDDGSLSGEVEVTFTGEDSYLRRLWERNEDDAGKKKDMQDLMQGWLSYKADIELEKVNDWKSSHEPLVATYKVTLLGFASRAGHHVLVPSALFAGAYTNRFTATQRDYPIVMEYAYDNKDDVEIKLPDKFKVDTLPKDMSAQNALADLAVHSASDNGSLHLTREFKLKGLFFDKKYYGAMRNYYQSVQAGANEQAVLTIAN